MIFLKNTSDYSYIRRGFGYVDMRTCPHLVKAAALILSQPGGRLFPPYTGVLKALGMARLYILSFLLRLQLQALLEFGDYLKLKWIHYTRFTQKCCIARK